MSISKIKFAGVLALLAIVVALISACGGAPPLISMTLYENTKHGFCIEYPEGWSKSVEEVEATLQIEFKDPEERFNAGVFLGYATEEVALADFVSYMKAALEAAPQFKLFSEGDVTISGGIPGYEIVCQAADETGKVEKLRCIMVVREQQHFFVGVGGEPADFDQQEEVLDAIIDSFRLLPTYTFVPPGPAEPGVNRPPVISSLTPSQTQVYPSGLIEIQCVASDPDDDKLSYEWSTTGGSFSWTGYLVTWRAPELYGTYDVTVTVKDGKGGSTKATITLSVIANHNPEIASLTAEPATLLPKGESIITCVASDPDGDVITYSWEASDGSIIGVGNRVTWLAPNKSGGFTITVIVDDGRGAQTRGDVLVTVASVQQTVTLNVEAGETGTVFSTGEKDTSKTIAGDSNENIGYRTFWSFNISTLRNITIKDARLIFTTRQIIGNPFHKTTGLGGLQLWKVSYGLGGLPDFDITGAQLREAPLFIWSQPIEVDVTQEVSNLVAGVMNRFQVKAEFTKPTNANDIAEYIEWSSLTLTVTYEEK